MELEDARHVELIQHLIVFPKHVYLCASRQILICLSTLALVVHWLHLNIIMGTAQHVHLQIQPIMEYITQFIKHRVHPVGRVHVFHVTQLIPHQIEALITTGTIYIYIVRLQAPCALFQQLQDYPSVPLVLYLLHIIMAMHVLHLYARRIAGILGMDATPARFLWLISLYILKYGYNWNDHNNWEYGHHHTHTHLVSSKSKWRNWWRCIRRWRRFHNTRFFKSPTC